MKKILLLITAFALSGIAFSQTVYKDFHDGQIYFKFMDDYKDDIPFDKLGNVKFTDIPVVRDILTKYKVRSLRKPFWMTGDTKLERTYHLQFTKYTEVDKLIRELENLNFIDYAEKIAIDRYFYTPNDKAVSDGNQQYLHLINAPQAWDITKGSHDIVIAITDSGVDLTHPDMQVNVWTNKAEKDGTTGIDDDGNGYIDDINGWNVASNNNDVSPELGAPHPVPIHGMHVAGIAGADTDNGKGLGSVSFNVRIMPVKTAAPNGQVLNSAESITYAAMSGADIINMSWGAGQVFTTVQNAINFAESKGCIMVGGTGNSDTEQKFYPAAYNNVISVAATAPGDTREPHSNYGTYVDISAPGEQILSLIPMAVHPGGVAFLTGTSHATPIISGTISLMKSVNPYLTISQARSCLKSTAVNIDALNPGFEGKLGAGRVDVAAAVSCAKALTTSTTDVEDPIELIQVVPNPSTGYFKVFLSGDDATNAHLIVRDVLGHVVLEKNVNGKLAHLDLSGESKGMYLVEVRKGDAWNSLRVVVE